MYGIHSFIFESSIDIKDWQSRPLEPIYPFVFMDAIHYKMREDGRILNRAAYIILGVDLEGNKDTLSITIGANESSKFWLEMLNDLKNRGVRDVLFFCVDGLSGFREAFVVSILKHQIHSLPFIACIISWSPACSETWILQAPISINISCGFGM